MSSIDVKRKLVSCYYFLFVYVFLSVLIIYLYIDQRDFENLHIHVLCTEPPPRTWGRLLRLYRLHLYGCYVQSISLTWP